MFSERTQVLPSRKRAALLKRIAACEGRFVGAVIRDAVDAYTSATSDERRAALERLSRSTRPSATGAT